MHDGHADLTNIHVLDGLMLLYCKRYREASDLAEKVKAAGMLAFFGMMMRMKNDG